MTPTARPPHSPSDAELMPHVGLCLQDKYLVEELIGRGGMGAVYRATHLELGEPLAIKFLHRQVAALPDMRSRFRREAVALARLRHPGIVSVLDFGEHDGELYMVMELIKGLALSDLLAERELPLLRVGDLFERVLQVLEVAHDAGVVHRDLKPDNIMVLETADRADHIKLLDFGLVHLQGPGDTRLTETGTVRGTPIYMSPEQCRGEHIGPASDVYSLGVSLYEALCGEVPFRGAEAATLMAMHLFVEPPPINEQPGGAHVPPGVAAVVSAALAKSPEQRPTARELRELLHSAVRGTDPVSLAEEAAKERARVTFLSRSERAPTAPLMAHSDADQEPTTGNVVLWVEDRERAALLHAALSLNGVSSYAFHKPELKSLQDIDVLLISARENPVQRLAHVRALDAGVPVLVFDVDGESAPLVRAGASDLVRSSTADAKVPSNVRRLLRRRR